MAGVIPMLTALFGATAEIAEKFPNFSEKQKKHIEKELEIYDARVKKFEKLAVEFDAGSNSDEIMGVSDSVREQKKKVQDLYNLYKKELSQ